MRDPQRKSIARSVGAFFGHIWQGVRTDPRKERSVIESDRRVEEECRRTDRGQDVILRRTTIEEIEVREERDR